MPDQPSPRRRSVPASPEERASLRSFRIALILIGASVAGLFWTVVSALSVAIGLPLAPLSWIAILAACSNLMLAIGQWLRRGRMHP